MLDLKLKLAVLRPQIERLKICISYELMSSHIMFFYWSKINYFVVCYLQVFLQVFELERNTKPIFSWINYQNNEQWRSRGGVRMGKSPLPPKKILFGAKKWATLLNKVAKFDSKIVFSRDNFLATPLIMSPHVIKKARNCFRTFMKFDPPKNYFLIEFCPLY